jgi:hypothetical protein
MSQGVRSGVFTKVNVSRPDLGAGLPATPDAFERRLRRLVTNVSSCAVGDDKEKLVFDFNLGEKAPRDAHRLSQQIGYTTREDFVRWAGTNKSVAFLDRKEVGEGIGVYRLREFCLRLPQPNMDDAGVSEMCEAVVSLVREVEPPPETAICLRNTKSLLPMPEYYEEKIVHIAAEGIAAHPDVLLDFIAEFIPEYRDRLL